ncbi:tetratricopeptide repeat protein [Kroppenstedtia eburnea]|uniref:tetratricopeptide repeat protein n=1 Tax=Kroppenstedtia eburnea TaxID=714067 RepID=UPI00362D50A0
MNSLELHEIGEIIRRVRKERRLRLEDLADENISPATISNIERGVPHVNPQRAVYLLEKLNIEMKDLPDLILGEKEKFKEDQFHLNSADLKREMGDVQGAIAKLDSLEIGDDHPLAPTLYFLKGKCYRGLRNWKRAERNLYKGIQLASQRPDSSNIEAVCFLELGLCQYLQNDLDGALKFTESGIDAFQQEGERQYVWHQLHANKGIYLERLGRTAAAMKVVEENWKDIDRMEGVTAKLTFYWLRSELNYRLELYDEAAHYAVEGLELARINRKFSSIFPLAIVLGNVYLRLGELEKAEECFMNALGCNDKLDDQKSISKVYIRLGTLYKLKKQYDQAAQSLEKAIGIGKEQNDVPRLTSAYIAMGELLLSHEKKREAIEYFNEALSLAKKHNLKKREHRALYGLASSWENIDEQEFQKCMHNMYKIQGELRQNEGVFIDEVD